MNILCFFASHVIQFPFSNFIRVGPWRIKDHHALWETTTGQKLGQTEAPKSGYSVPVRADFRQRKGPLAKCYQRIGDVLQR